MKDTDPKYTVMCEKAMEIHKQILSRPLRIDQLYELLEKTHRIGAIIRGIYEFWEPEHFCPNQSDDIVSGCELKLTCTCESVGIERRKQFTTLEQITLAYLMDELYDKHWNGCDWI